MKKIALVVGATSGIGEETSILFSNNDFKVVVAGRNADRGNRIISKINENGGEAIFLQVDISDKNSVAEMVNKCLQTFGSIDVAINNAGIEGVLQPIEEIDDDNWMNVMNINLKGIMYCMKYEFKAMKTKKRGVILNVSSSLTSCALPNTGAYTASKSGVDALSKIAAIEFSDFNIRVNVVNPGAVDTPMLNRLYNAEQLENIKSSNPLKTIAEAKDVASTLLWLCSSSSKHVNGASIIVDGGAVLRSG